jgi:hypothetical protein
MNEKQRIGIVVPPNHFAESPFVNFVPSAKRVVKKLKVHGF